MTDISRIPVGKDVPKNINVIVESPEGTRNKYEYDKDLGIIKLDRVLFSPVHYPGDYGFVPNTLWDDGDPLDVLVVTREPTHPGVLIEARPVGAIEMIDSGEDDIKIIAVNANNPNYDDIHEMDDLPTHLVKEIRHFFEVYKQLQGKEVKINRTLNREEAEKAIIRSIEMHQKG